MVLPQKLIGFCRFCARFKEILVVEEFKRLARYMDFSKVMT